MPGIILISCVILLIILLLNRKTVETKVQPVIAGDADTICEIKEERLVSNFVFFLDMKHLVNSKNAFAGRLVGNSMVGRGLHRDDVVLGKFVDAKREKLKKGDLVIIRITDTSKKGFGSLKIREFADYLDGDCIKTLKYVDNKTVESSPHKILSVVAVVNRYVKSNRSLNKVLVSE
jgi:hypothetical protein